MSTTAQDHHHQYLAKRSARDLLRVQATLESNRQRQSHGCDRPGAAVAAPSHAAAPIHAHAMGDACMYACECGLKFTASTCPHTVCPACGREQLW
jgi:hypothetical protein